MSTFTMKRFSLNTSHNVRALRPRRSPDINCANGFTPGESLQCSTKNASHFLPTRSLTGPPPGTVALSLPWAVQVLHGASSNSHSLRPLRDKESALEDHMRAAFPTDVKCPGPATLGLTSTSHRGLARLSVELSRNTSCTFSLGP